MNYKEIKDKCEVIRNTLYCPNCGANMQDDDEFEKAGE